MKLNDYDIFDHCTEKLVNELLQAALLEKTQKMKILSCMNPHSYYMADFDRDYRNSLLNSDWLIPDGTGVVLAARLLRSPLCSKISGYDIFEKMSEEINNLKNIRVFFLGSTNTTLAKIIEKYQSDYPNILVVGAYSPPFEPTISDAVNRKIQEEIKKSKADIIWVGLSAPKQEKWMYYNADKLESKLAFGIGAVFDFYVGNIKRSSPFFRNIGLEWLPRLIQEPRRLWRRTFVSAPYFILAVIKYAASNTLGYERK